MQGIENPSRQTIADGVRHHRNVAAVDPG